MAGRYFDEWQVGDRVSHSITRTVTEADNLLITTLTHNPQPLHLDFEAAAKTEFGRPLVNSCFTFSLLVGVSVHDTTLGVLVANLGFDKVGQILGHVRNVIRSSEPRSAVAEIGMSDLRARLTRDGTL